MDSSDLDCLWFCNVIYRIESLKIYIFNFNLVFTLKLILLVSVIRVREMKIKTRSGGEGHFEVINEGCVGGNLFLLMVWHAWLVLGVYFQWVYSSPRYDCVNLSRRCLLSSIILLDKQLSSTSSPRATLPTSNDLILWWRSPELRDDIEDLVHS